MQELLKVIPLSVLYKDIWRHVVVGSAELKGISKSVPEGVCVLAEVVWRNATTGGKTEAVASSVSAIAQARDPVSPFATARSENCTVLSPLPGTWRNSFISVTSQMLSHQPSQRAK